MKRLIISIFIVAAAVSIFLFLPRFLVYGITGWQIGQWADEISNWITNKTEK
jgi:hypothetical protein